MPINPEHFSCIFLQIRHFSAYHSITIKIRIFLCIYFYHRSLWLHSGFTGGLHKVFLLQRIQFRITCGLYLRHLFNFETGTDTQSFSEFCDFDTFEDYRPIILYNVLLFEFVDISSYLDCYPSLAEASQKWWCILGPTGS